MLWCLIVSVVALLLLFLFFFFFNDTATTEIYTLSLHDALPISLRAEDRVGVADAGDSAADWRVRGVANQQRSEEHTSELQSRLHLVCRLLLEKKKNTHNRRNFLVCSIASFLLFLIGSVQLLSYR